MLRKRNERSRHVKLLFVSKLKFFGLSGREVLGLLSAHRNKCPQVMLVRKKSSLLYLDYLGKMNQLSILCTLMAVGVARIIK